MKTIKNTYQQKQFGLTATTTITSNLEATQHQLTVECAGAPTLGTMTVSVRPTGATTFTLLKDHTGEDTLSLDLALGPHTIRFDGRFEEVKVTPTAYNGTSFGVVLVGW